MSDTDIMQEGAAGERLREEQPESAGRETERQTAAGREAERQAAAGRKRPQNRSREEGEGETAGITECRSLLLLFL